MIKSVNFNKNEASEALRDLRTKYEYREDMTVSDVNAIMQELKKSISFYNNCPLFVMTTTYYETTKGKFAQVVCNVRPSKKESTDKTLVTKIILTAHKDIFKDFVTDMGKWIDYYNDRKGIAENIYELNEKMVEIMEEAMLPFDIQFALGNETISYISDNKVVFGITEEVAKHIGNLAIFNKDEMIADLAKERIINTLLACDKPTDFRKSKIDFVEELGLRTRKSLSKIIRESVKRSAKTQRVGQGYIQNKEDGYIGIIEKEVASVTDIPLLLKTKYTDRPYYVVDNVNATINEKKDNKTKIIISYLFVPYCEATGETYNIPLSTLFNERGVALFE